MLKKIRPSARYSLAVVSVAAAAVIRMLLSRWVHDFPFFSFYLAVTVTTWFAGSGPGLASAVMGYLVTDIFFFSGGGFGADPFGALIYLSVTLTIVLFGGSLHQAQKRAERAATEARHRQHELEQEVMQRKKAEEALRLAQEKLRDHTVDLERLVAERTANLSETIRSLEGFCYSIAHDLRAPIRAMQGYATVLAEEASLSDAARDYTHRIRRASLRMDQLVHDLLLYGRLTHEAVERSPVHLEPVVKKVLEQLAEEIKARQAEIKVIHPLAEVLGHPSVIEQALVNLVSNALKFTRPGVCPHIEIRSEQLPKLVRLGIEDNGIGIGAQYHDRIFNVFERVHRQEEYSGTGIGLAIVKKGVERMGGRVWVESQLGKGSIFWIELAAVPGSLPPPSETAA
jgi:signal transduction histidine kinase